MDTYAHNPLTSISLMHACLFSDMEASLAEYLMEHIKSSDGKSLLKSIISGKILQLPKERATLVYKRYVTRCSQQCQVNNVMKYTIVHLCPCLRVIPLVS